MMRKGVDLSTWQKNVDYKKLKESGIEFAIIRVCYGTSLKDNMFETHYRGLKENGIKVGAYVYSVAENYQEGVKEASVCLDLIKNKEFELPIFYDIEDKLLLNMSKDERNKMIINFCEYIKGAGFNVGVYANLNWFNNYLDVKLFEKYYIWLAQWADKHTADFRVDFWQYSSKGYVNGILGNVDLDYQLCELNIKEDIKIRKSNEEIVKEVLEGKWRKR